MVGWLDGYKQFSNLAIFIYMLSAISDFISKVTRGGKIRAGGEDEQWKKVNELVPGMMIAVPKDELMAKWLNGQIANNQPSDSDVLWDEIVSIRRLSPERVWDIEVEGTRIFVAGHLLETPCPKTYTLLHDEPPRGPPIKRTAKWLNGQMVEKNNEDTNNLTMNKWFGGFFAHNTFISGNIGIGTAVPSAKLDVVGGGKFSGDVTLGDGSGTDLIVGDGTGKIDVGTVDPPFTINGEKYATYLPSMTGVKEETTGFVNTNELVPGIGYRKIIDFNNTEKGSDLWLFSKVSDLAKNLDEMVVLLTPTDNTRTWYKIDKNLNQLIIYSARPANIAYRLTAPRFDSENFQNTRDSDTVGFVINSPDNKVTLDQNGYLPQDSLGGISGYDILVSSGASLNADNGNIYELRTYSGEIVYDFASYSQAIIANIKAGLIEVAQGIFDTIVANSAVIKNLSVENLTAGNISQLGNSQILSPVGDLTATDTASLSRLKTDSIAPLSDQGRIEFDGAISVKGKDGLEVASIDSSGDVDTEGDISARSASFSGQLSVSDLSNLGDLNVSGETTISGELSVNNLKVSGLIESEQINKLQSSFGDLLGRISTLENESITANITVVPTLTVTLNPTLPAPTIDLSISSASESSPLNISTISAESSSSSATLLDALAGFLTSSSQLNQNVEQFIATSTAFINPASIPNPDNNVVLTDNIALTLSAEASPQNQVRTLSDLQVYGQSSLADTVISGQLVVDGGIVIENNKVASLGNTLYLSSLNSIDILGGRLIIDKSGNLDVAGQIIAREGIVTDQISPLSRDLSINLSKGSTTDPDSFGKLIIKGLNENNAASFDVLGNATISGELTLNKLNLNYKEASPSSISGLLSEIGR